MSDNIYGLGDPLLLERIDKLIACGIGTLINLPQIVVIGDQSSGKSSVLAGLIRKSLPRDSGLCTRFATHIVFRRSQQESIVASITAAADASDEHRTIVEAWQADIPSLDDTNFIRIMAEVHEVMGLRSGSDDSGRPTFSNDVFRLEISGPDQEHLSVIDVPGIFKNTTSGVTTKADIELVRNMVLNYMENPRSVMLAVVPANVDVATQEILELASDVDPDGDRTLGVLTKPDLVDKGAEDKVIELVEGKTRHMKLGWHVVRNPGQQHLHEASIDRNALEMDFFRSHGSWKKVDKEKIGIERLRSRLQEVLSGLVRREFPKVKQENKRRLMIAEKSLLEIGPQRSTSNTQSAFLTDLATRFQRLVMLALSTKYGIDELFDEFDALRLAPAISERYTAFSDTMETQGHTYAFMKDSSLQGAATVDQWIDNTTFYSSNIKSKKIKKLAVVSLANSRQDTAEDLAELADLLHGPTRVDDVDNEGMESWLQSVYKTNRGFELGTFGSHILATTMKKQSAKWEHISLGYISDVVAIVHRFIMTALDALCADQRLRTTLKGVLFDGLAERYRKAIDQVKFLLYVERNGTPMTANHYFNENLQKCREARVRKAMSLHAIDDCSHGKVVRLDDTTFTHPMSNTEQMVQDIHDILQSYYKVARKRFVDNVLKQATDYYLLEGPDAPAGFFSPNFVNSLDPAELEHIAGESSNVKKLRARLEKEIVSLTEAKGILTGQYA